MKIETKYNIGDVVYVYSSKGIAKNRVEMIQIVEGRIVYLLEDGSYRNERELSPTEEGAKESYCEAQMWKVLSILGTELKWIKKEGMNIDKALKMVSDYIDQFSNEEIPF